VQDQVLSSETPAPVETAPAPAHILMGEARDVTDLIIDALEPYKFPVSKVELSNKEINLIMSKNKARFEEGAEHYKEISKLKTIKHIRYITALAVMINNDLDGLPVRDLKPLSDWNLEGYKVNKGEKMVYADKTFFKFLAEDENGEEKTKFRTVTYKLFHRSQVTKASAEELEKFNKKRQKLNEKRTTKKSSK